MEPSPATPQRPWLRLVLAVSLDGRLAPAAGGAAQIGGPGDRRVLEESLAWADACLIGAETLRRHGTTCLIRDADLLRQRQGRTPQPLAIAVSRGRSLPGDLRFFQQPLRRWLLTLAASGGIDAPGAAAGVSRQLDCGQAESSPSGFECHLHGRDWTEALTALATAGLERVVVLGGATLAGSLVAEGLLDELQLSLCPVLLGGPHGWLPAAVVPGQQPWRWQLGEQRLLESGELLLRYRRADAEEARH